MHNYNLIQLTLFLDKFRHKYIIGYTSGVFDILHSAHIDYLHKCQSKCDILVIGVDDDYLVAMKKGIDRPYQCLTERLEKLSRLGITSFLLKKTSSFTKIAPVLCPDVYFIPHNKELSKSKIDLLESLRVTIETFPYTKGVSTTLIIKRLKNAMANPDKNINTSTLKQSQT